MKINKSMKEILPLLFAATCLSANAATVIIPTSPTGGTPYNANTLPSYAVTDGFAYDPDNPTSTSPDQSDGGGGTSSAFLSANNDAQNYWSATVAVPSGETLGYMDYWGRIVAGADHSVDSRHQDLVITLTDGSSNTWVSAAWSGVSGGASGSYGRMDFSTASGTGTVDLTDIVNIRVDHSSGNTDYLHVAELRLASVPEPSSAALLGLSGLALILRRRK